MFAALHPFPKIISFGWYLVVVSTIVQKFTHMARKRFDVNCGSLSDGIVDCVLKLGIGWSKNVAVTAVGVVSADGIDSAGFEYLSVVTPMN